MQANQTLLLFKLIWFGISVKLITKKKKKERKKKSQCIHRQRQDHVSKP